MCQDNLTNMLESSEMVDKISTAKDTAIYSLFLQEYFNTFHLLLVEHPPAGAEGFQTAGYNLLHYRKETGENIIV